MSRDPSTVQQLPDDTAAIQRQLDRDAAAFFRNLVSVLPGTGIVDERELAKIQQLAGLRIGSSAPTDHR